MKGAEKMTMPHLMNCPHSCDGWCLECVKELNDSANKKVDTWYAAYMELLGIADACFLWERGAIADNELRKVIKDHVDVSHENT